MLHEPIVNFARPHVPVGATPADETDAHRLLLGAYSEWLRMEHRLLHIELFPDEDSRVQDHLIPDGAELATPFHLPCYPARWQDMPQPSTRAAHVLAAVGCEIGGEQPDRELLALAGALPELVAAAGRSARVFNDLQAQSFACVGPVERHSSAQARLNVLAVVEERLGVAAAVAASEADDDKLLELTEAMAGIRATTLAGLIAKARAVEHGEDAIRDSIVADLLAMASKDRPARRALNAAE